MPPRNAQNNRNWNVVILQAAPNNIPPDDEPGRGFYADIDIDLGNPKRDLAGFFIHLGELISEGKTDHIKLNKKLKKDPILSGHLHYTITEE